MPEVELMKSPQSHMIVQIEITNACMYSCSNCTRFCGHHQKPFFMDFNTFSLALLSMKGHPGMVGIMGGEPTLHPGFEELILYYANVIGAKSNSMKGIQPIADFGEHICNQDLLDRNVRRGLWTSLHSNYYKHYELIQDVFDYQCINDHRHSGLHQAILVSRKDLDIGDAEWRKKRDSCWIQNMWSSSITPKGAFFCEVAAAMDMLFDGPGGWPIEPGWWKRKPEDFGDQLDWCESCGGCLDVPRTQANIEIDDISPLALEKLRKIDSLKVRKGKFRMLSISDYSKSDCESVPWAYIPNDSHDLRVSKDNRVLYPRAVDGVIVVTPDSEDRLAITLAINRRHFDNVVVVAPETSCVVRRAVEDNKALLVEANDLASEGLELGELLNRALERLSPTDWIVMIDDTFLLTHDFRTRIGQWIFNPGCLHYYPARSTVTRPEVYDAVAKHRNTLAFVLDPSGQYMDREADKKLYLFHPNAMSIRGELGRLYQREARNYMDPSFPCHWPAQKVIVLSNLVQTIRGNGPSLFHKNPPIWQGIGL
jgi:hypothetical protein